MAEEKRKREEEEQRRREEDEEEMRRQEEEERREEEERLRKVSLQMDSPFQDIFYCLNYFISKSKCENSNVQKLWRFVNYKGHKKCTSVSSVARDKQSNFIQIIKIMIMNRVNMNIIYDVLHSAYCNILVV